MRARQTVQLYFQSFRRALVVRVSGIQKLGPRLTRRHFKYAILVLVLLLFLFLLTRTPDPVPLSGPDSGLFYGLAKELDSKNSFVKIYPLLDPPQGRTITVTDQGLPLLAVLLWRGIRHVSPQVTLLAVCQYFPLLIFVLLVFPIFLIGRQLGGSIGGFLSVMLLCTLAGIREFGTLKMFDRQMPAVLLSAWTVYFALRMFSSESAKDSLLFGSLAALVYGLFGLIWPGWLYLIPAMIGGMIFALILDTMVSKKVYVSRYTCTSLGILLTVVGSTLLVLPFGAANWSGTIQLIAEYMGFKEQRIEIGKSLGGSPPSWLEGIRFGLYQAVPPGAEQASPASLYATILTLLLIPLGMLCIFLTRKQQFPFVLAWFVVLLAMVWPGKGAQRFFNLWVPFVPPVMSAALAFPARRIPKAMTCILLVLILPLFYNAVVASPKVNLERCKATAEGLYWLAENAPRGSVVAGDWEIGYYIAGFASCKTLSDPASWMSAKVETVSNNIPARIGKEVGGEVYPLGDLIPLQPPPYGRCIDSVLWVYLCENELKDLLRYYKANGLPIDYLTFLGRYDPAREMSYVRRGHS